MPHDNPTVEMNNRLLGLYLQIVAGGETNDEDSAIAELSSIRDALGPTPYPSTLATFDRYAQLISLHLEPSGRSRLQAILDHRQDHYTRDTSVAPPPAFDGQSRVLGPLIAGGRPGISVVTCSMNRNENLIKALPSWLANPEVSEVVIVDWSSKVPVETDLRQVGISDPRIRILRVESEPRWVLSYAFNAGFRAAACDTILKVDADIVLSPDFFQRNHVIDGSFIAGNWRSAGDDQSHVNGFFFISRQMLHRVGGFNEYITTYGWDDDDIYDRLTLLGQRRRDVANGTILHLPHDDEDRIGGPAQNQGPVTLGADLASGTAFLIRRNRYIAAVMPPWDDKSIHLPFRMLTRTDTIMSIQREGWVPSNVPSHIQSAARVHALAELASWRLGRRVLELAPDRLELLLNRTAKDVSRIDVEVAIAAPQHVIKGAGRYLVLDLNGGILDANHAPLHLDAAFLRLIAAARRWGLTAVLRAPHPELPHRSPDCLRALPLIPTWEPIGDIPRIALETLLAPATATSTDLGIDLNTGVIEHLSLSAPATWVPRPRLYMDAQHGLGNRLRAIGSAAAIAAASDRELVIVWQPDDHCDGRFSDLFDYDGAVVETRFVEAAGDQGCDLYNYMTAEAGAEKDALIHLDTSRDIYARAAFVLNSPHSSWEAENRFLQNLTPVGPVRALVASVRHPNDLSAHVRMEAGAGLDHNTYDRPENWRQEDHALIHEWRAKSHFSHFLRRIDALIAEGRAERIFLAADLPETYAEFQQRYGDRLAWLPRSLYDRSTEQLHYALADAILLSQSPLLLGSTWSSFSELAMRLSPQKVLVEMSGRDF
jgi:hypothetical protein